MYTVTNLTIVQETLSFIRTSPFHFAGMFLTKYLYFRYRHRRNNTVPNNNASAKVVLSWSFRKKKPTQICMSFDIPLLKKFVTTFVFDIMYLSGEPLTIIKKISKGKQLSCMICRTIFEQSL